MPKTLLLEIGTEELPASFVARALEAMPAIATELLAQARLGHGACRSFGTPRRLALVVDDVADAQRDRSEELTGPPEKAAFDAAGKPTKAAVGFAQRLGVEPSALYVVDTPKGRYVACKTHEAGKPANELIGPLLETLAARIPFAKSMRWSDVETSFGRPVHWIIALLGDDVVPMTFAGVRSGRTTRGHRFLDAKTHEVANANVYVEVLRRAHVLVDAGERRDLMVRRLVQAAGDDTLVEDTFLVGECATLVEEPFVVRGTFDATFLELPEEVIETVIRFHQRYFALRGKDGRLLPSYLTVVNTALSPDNIAKNNDRVCRARLEDARFFVTEDGKKKLETRRERLGTVVFHNKLGSVGDKVARIEKIAVALADADPTLRDRVARAASLAKCDLVTLIVGEFPELQGVMGRVYAAAEGEPPAVADAIRDHYLPKGAGDAVPTEPVAACVALADRLDTLVGIFGIGITPSGSADPFALRRAALAVIRIALEGPFDIDLRASLELAYDQFAADVHGAPPAPVSSQSSGVTLAATGRLTPKLAPRDAVIAALDELFRGRLRAMWGESFPHDVVDACLGAWAGASAADAPARARRLRDVRARLDALTRFRALPESESLAVAFKRAFNITKDVALGSVDPALFTQPQEGALWDAWSALRGEVEAAIESGDYERALVRTAALRAAIDTYFDEVFVNVEDERVRNNRLALLGTIAKTVRRVAHVNLLVTEAPVASAPEGAASAPAEQGKPLDAATAGS